jgi:ribonuclease VapC
MFVLDASALLALMLNEDGADVVRQAPRGSEISIINFGEVLTRLVKLGRSANEEWAAIDRLPYRIRAFRDAHAAAVARMQPTTEHLGLSFGDRACLVQAQFSGFPVLTADGRMAQAQVGLDIRMIR